MLFCARPLGFTNLLRSFPIGHPTFTLPLPLSLAATDPGYQYGFAVLSTDIIAQVKRQTTGVAGDEGSAAPVRKVQKNQSAGT